ncbi:MAG: RNA polymerase sigma factor [Gemmataceae bacterium]
MDFHQLVTDKFTRGLIRRKAKQLVRRPAFFHLDGEDVAQELFLRVWQQVPKFSAAKSHIKTFVTTIVERYVANMVRDSVAQKRTPPSRLVSLSNHVCHEDGEVTSRASVISNQDAHNRLGFSPRSDEERAKLRLEVEDVLARLSPSDRDICKLLQNLSTSEAARELGLPRTTLLSRIHHIRRQFEKAGF